MKILAIETSCDETAAAVIEGAEKDLKVELLSNIISSSIKLHAKTGGIIPEKAAREQVKYIIPVIKKALSRAKTKLSDIDSLAVTVGPGLIGSLLVGVETAKTLAYVLNKPIVSVNHLIGHIYANFITTNEQRLTTNKKLGVSSQKLVVEFPAIALIVSGGHTDLVLMKKHGDLKWLGGTRDDAAGEAFDKIGRLLGLPYPGGPAIEKAAKNGNSKRFLFPRPMIDSDDFDFSFSGLKTAVMRQVTGSFPRNRRGQDDIADLSASVQQSIIDVLIKKTLKAAQKYNVKSILLGGGVSANQKLREDLKSLILNHKSSIKFFAPAKNFCTDNAAMIGAAAFFNYKPVLWKKVTTNPDLYFD